MTDIIRGEPMGEHRCGLFCQLWSNAVDRGQEACSVTGFETCILLLGGKDKLSEGVVYDHELMPPA